MGIEDIFDVVGTMVDIVKGGIDSYKTGEKLDELIEKSVDDYKDNLTNEEKQLYKNYLKAKDTYEGKEQVEDSNSLLEKLEASQVKYLEALEENESLPQDFRDEIKEAVEELKKANNMALENLSKRFEKRAENDEQKELIKKTIEESKMK